MPAALILASASPRRRHILRQIGVEFEVVASGAPEVLEPGETPESFTRRVAREKAAVVASSHPERWVLGADTVVVLDQRILGKPGDAAAACEMLRGLSARLHRVVTGVALIGPHSRTIEDFAVASEVEFRPVLEAEIDAYVRSGEPLDKAGAYAIQGGASSFVTRVIGSYTNVVGLPIAETRTLLERHRLLSGAPTAELE